MERNIFLLSVSVVLLLLNNLSLAGEYCQDQHKDCDNSAGGIKPRNSQQLSDLSTDFEVGSQNFWTDDSPSQTGVRWKIEDINSSWELDNPAPNPPAGRNYIRVDRGATLSFGIAVLRSPTLPIPASSNNNISISFDFWIRSKWPQFTNLELYLNENGNERLLVSLWIYSDINNLNWVTYPVSFSPLRSGSEFSLAFYAYCGTDVVDAVAIDNIRWTDPSQTTIDSTVTESTTTPTVVQDCGGNFTATFNNINLTSSSYPYLYEGNQNCSFVIVAPTPQGIVRLNFYDIDIPYHDNLKVYDGDTPNSPVIYEWNGETDTTHSQIFKAVIFCESGKCLMKQLSDQSPQYNYRGWLASYTVCGGSYIATEKRTAISSPNYPNFYYNSEVCYYNITTLSPTGKITLQIIDISMEPYYDSLWVIDGMTTESPTLFIGSQLPAVPYFVNSSGPGILIRHRSDFSWGVPKPFKGWLATFEEIVD
ncbi:CUB and sushi domain-containing protein 1-like [Daphnia pulicaria]|uniref:CUB and sushi domain-containing protein 1-like n=1 Tax=Daphnia pulicaria TaxID=35523 RepID=UPI001EEC524B|nr:CUB and sushi domain-containing protein 1-like [Daphnia pulicaria]